MLCPHPRARAWHPGPRDAGYSLGLRHIGPLVLSPPGNAAREVQTVAMKNREELCGRRLDWVEVLG